MALYNNIADSRLTAGRGWLPALSLQLLGNDWALASSGFDMQFPIDTYTVAGLTIYVTQGSFEVYFPDAWDVDDTYSESLAMKLTVELEHRSQDGNVAYQMRLRDVSAVLNSTETVSNTSTSFQWEEMTLTYDNSATWPTGARTIDVQVKWAGTSPADTMEFRRLFGRGPTCRYEVVLT